MYPPTGPKEIIATFFLALLVLFFIYVLVRLVSYAWHASKEQAKLLYKKEVKNGIKNQKQERPARRTPKA